MAEEIAKLDAPEAVLWRRAADGHVQLFVIDRLLAVQRARAKLLDLDAPQRVDVSGAGGNPLAALIMRMTALDAGARDIEPVAIPTGCDDE